MIDEVLNNLWDKKNLKKKMVTKIDTKTYLGLAVMSLKE